MGAVPTLSENNRFFLVSAHNAFASSDMPKRFQGHPGVPVEFFSGSHETDSAPCGYKECTEIVRSILREPRRSMMKSLKNIAALAAAAALSLTIASCAGSGAPSPDAAPSGADTPIEELVKVNGVAVHLDENNKTATVEIEVAEGESLYQMSKFDAGEAESSTSHNGEWLMSDYFYEGFSAGENGVDPGTYTVDVKTEDAVGTIWIFAYDSDAVDYENMDAEQIVDFLLGQIS